MSRPSPVHARSTRPGVFKPSAQRTGPLLNDTRSVLGIQCFIPEIFTDRSSDAALLSVFSGSKRYGFSAEWRDGLSALVRDYGQAGVAYNAWNGYTEGLVAVPTTERGREDYDWLQGLDPQ